MEKAKRRSGIKDREKEEEKRQEKKSKSKKIGEEEMTKLKRQKEKW